MFGGMGTYSNYMGVGRDLESYTRGANMKYISEERLRELFGQYKAVAELNCNLPHFDGMLDMLEMVIDECKEYVVNEEALAHDAGYAEGYNRGFEDGKHYSTWQPIDTAPKDRWILAINAHNNYRQFVVEWRDGRWYYGEGAMDWIDNPTHWQELPLPPQT